MQTNPLITPLKMTFCLPVITRFILIILTINIARLILQSVYFLQLYVGSIMIRNGVWFLYSSLCVFYPQALAREYKQ